MALDMTEDHWKYLLDPNCVEYYLMPRIKSLIGTNKKVLDIGTRSGIYLLYYCDESNNKGLGIDLGSVDSALETKSKSRLTNVDFLGNIDATTPLPFDDNSFDVSVASAIIEHIWVPGDRYMVEEIIRVSKEKVIISTPLYVDRIQDYDRGRGCGDHINMFNEDRFHDFLKQFGFHHNVEVIMEGYSTLIGIIEM